MAGIGFRLNAMMHSGHLSTASSAFGYGVVLAAGQWLIAVIGIAAISVIATGRLAPSVVTDFRILVVFAVMIAMISVAPIALVNTRLVSNALFHAKPQDVPALLMGGLTASTLISLMLGIAVLFGAFQLDLTTGIAALVMVVLFAQLWVISGLAGAIQETGWMILAYVLGGVVSVIGAIWAGFASHSAAQMVLGYCVGLALTTGLMALRVLIGFPFGLPAPDHALVRLMRAIPQYWHLSLGAAVAALALWVDKWVVWASLSGHGSALGLPYSPIYDTAIFFGLVSMIPGLALLVIQLETRFFASFRAFLSDMQGHAPLEEVEAMATKLATDTMSGLHRILLMQGAISLALIALGPSLAWKGIIPFQQVPVFLLTIFGAWFLFLATAASTLLLHLDMRRQFAAVQICFLVGVAVASSFLQPLNLRFLGIGFAAGVIPAAILAYVLLVRTLDALPYHLLRASALRAANTQRRPRTT